MTAQIGDAAFTEVKPRPLSAAKAHSLLANEVRREVLAILAQSELTVGAIAKTLGLDSQTISRALKELRNAGLVAYRVEKTSHHYRLCSSVQVKLADAAVEITIATADGSVVAEFDLRTPKT